jgi:hypothetical protein
MLHGKQSVPVGVMSRESRVEWGVRSRESGAKQLPARLHVILSEAKDLLTHFRRFRFPIRDSRLLIPTSRLLTPD